jgi:hypothetical protein
VVLVFSPTFEGPGCILSPQLQPGFFMCTVVHYSRANGKMAAPISVISDQRRRRSRRGRYPREYDIEAKLAPTSREQEMTRQWLAPPSMGRPQ